jgi:hypothetical protein
VRNSPSSRAAVLSILIAATTVAAVSAHRRDEYLQAARLAIDPGRVELQLDLTPGISLADRLIVEMDRDHDGAVSDREAQAYASAVQHDLVLELDGRLRPLTLVESLPATAESMTKGEGTLNLKWQALLPPLAPGTHRLHFHNAHHADIGVYLANVLIPASDRVAVTAQERDVDQRDFTVDYELKAAASARARHQLLVALGGAVAALAVLLGRLSAAR